jgi:hypothetical protein
MPKTVKDKFGNEWCELYSGYKAPKSLYASLKAHINSVEISKWSDKPRFTLRQICGRDYWEGITNNQMKRLAGMCFRTMVREGDFPIEFKQYKKSATNYYRYKH